MFSLLESPYLLDPDDGLPPPVTDTPPAYFFPEEDEETPPNSPPGGDTPGSGDDLGNVDEPGTPSSNTPTSIPCILLGQKSGGADPLRLLVIKDIETGTNYNIIVEDGVLALMEVLPNVVQDSGSTYTIIDNGTGIAYNLFIENGKVGLEEI